MFYQNLFSKNMSFYQNLFLRFLSFYQNLCCKSVVIYVIKNLNFPVGCLIREKVVTFRMVKLNLLLSIFLITK